MGVFKIVVIHWNNINRLKFHLIFDFIYFISYYLFKKKYWMFTGKFLEESIVNTSDNFSPKKLIIFLHGLGSNGDDLISLAPFMQRSLKDFTFIAPNGLEECSMAGFGYQWFSLEDRSEEVIYSELLRIEDRVNEYIDQKLEEYNLESKDLFLVGFSQGTMTSLHVGLSRKEKLGGIVGFSGALRTSPDHEYKNKTPVCLIHGMYDDIVPFSLMEDAKGKLEEADIYCETHPIGDLMHSINERGVEYAVNFIKERFERS